MQKKPNHNPQRLAPTKLIDSTVDVENRPAYKIIHLFFKIQQMIYSKMKLTISKKL